MARPRERLARAPVREALIDLQFEPRASLEAIDRFADSLSSRVSKRSDIWETLFGFEAPAPDRPPQSHAKHAAVGRRLDLGAGQHVLQCRVNGFTLSRLSPYGDWSELRSLAHELWTSFSEQVKVVTVTRIAVRYINELKLPLPLGDFADYLTAPPVVPPELPQSIAGYLLRVNIPDVAHNGTTVVTQALEGPPAEGPDGLSVTVILDIDCFRQPGAELALSPSIWNALDSLRDQKNRVFFAHLTEKAVEMYE